MRQTGFCTVGCKARVTARVAYPDCLRRVSHVLLCLKCEMNTAPYSVIFSRNFGGFILQCNHFHAFIFTLSFCNAMKGNNNFEGHINPGE